MRRSRMSPRAPSKSWAWIVVPLALTSTAAAQEPINAANSATAPSPGNFTLMEQFRYNKLDLDTGPRDRRGDLEDYQLMSMLHWGLTRDVSLVFKMPTTMRKREYDVWSDTDWKEGVGDLTAVVKWRFWQRDTGSLDTQRMSFIAGAEIRTGDTPFTNDAYNPVLGLGYTQIRGRHGINASAEWTITTDGNDEPIYPGESTADRIRYDFAYLYRLYPKQYTAATPGGLYALIELNGVSETNGDNELLVSPGLMYEAAKWTLELSFQTPAWEDVDHRATVDYALVAGLRFSF